VLAAEGAAHHHQAGLVLGDAQQPGLLRGGAGGLDGVLGAPQRGGLEQVLGGRAAREVLRQVVRRGGGVHVAVLALQGHAVVAVHDQGVEDGGPLGHAQLGGQRGVGGLGLLQHHLAVVAVAAGGDLLVHVVQGQRGRDLVERRGEGAHALHPVDEALGLQLLEGAVDRHAADAELGHQLGLGGHLGARGPVAGGEPVLEVLLDPGVGRQGGGSVRDHGGADATCMSLSRQVASAPFDVWPPCVWRPPCPLPTPLPGRAR
jgi:hypothetical protein